MTIEDGAASVGGSPEQFTTSAPVVSAPVADAAPAAGLPPTTPSGPNEKSYFDRMQEAVATADGVSLEEEVRQVAESVADAPVSGDENTETTTNTQVVDNANEQAAVDEAKPEGTEPKPPIDYTQLPDNIRAELRRANLAPEVKEALAQSWYERKAFHDVGFSVEQARYLKSVGFSPEVAVDRLRMHPTVEDAAQDASLANVARTLISDFQNNPSAMLDGLSANVPEAFPAFAKTVAGRLQKDAPEVYGSLASGAMDFALHVLESETPEGDFEAREKIAYVRNQLFPGADKPAVRQPGAFDPTDPIHQKYRELKENEQRQYQAQAETFTNAITTYSQQAVLGEVTKRVEAALPKGTDSRVAQRAAAEITELVAKDFFGNRGVMESMDRAIKQSDLSQASLDAIVGYAYNRAVPLIAVHAKPVLEFWSQNAKVTNAPTIPAVTSPQRSAVGSRTVANAPSAARIPASSPPQPGSSATPPKEFIASGRKQGWDTGRIISAWLNGQR